MDVYLLQVKRATRVTVYVRMWYYRTARRELRFFLTWELNRLHCMSAIVNKQKQAPWF
jgi:hypothetical protein